MLYAHILSVCGSARMHIVTYPLQHLNLELLGSQCYLS